MMHDRKKESDMKDQVIGISKLLSMPGYVHQVPVSNTGAIVRVSSEDDILVSGLLQTIWKATTRYHSSHDRSGNGVLGRET